MATTRQELEAKIATAAERILTTRRISEESLPRGIAEGSPAGEAYAVTLEEADGTESATAIKVLVLPGRAGLTAGGNPEWTDLYAHGGESAAREAVGRYLAGEMAP